MIYLPPESHNDQSSWPVTVFQLMSTAAQSFDTTGVTVADQVSLLQALQTLTDYDHAAAHLWTPVFAVW